MAPEQGEKLQSEAGATKKRVEDLIQERRLVDEVELAKVKSRLLNIPYTKADPAAVTPDLLQLISETTAFNYKVVPLSRDKNLLVVGMLHPEDLKAQEALRFAAKQNRVSLGIYLITPSDFEAVMRKYSPFSSQVEAAVKSLNIKAGTGLGGTKRVRLEEATAVTEEAPVIKIVSSTLKEAVAGGASDIHIEPQRDRLRIRLRVDGVLTEISNLPLELHQPIISRVKILSNLKIDETRIPQDGRFRTELFDRDIDYRVSTFPTPAGEKAAIRVLDPRVGLKKLEELGLRGHNEELALRAIAKPFGMILISGPTGSGKTTTLYALMQKLNQDDVNIVTLEDPVEYTIDGVNQSQVRPEIGYDFATGLRQILRQDPDVMMVGEIRDNETAALAVHSALTGHIVLSTLHTNNAMGVIPRLLDMKVDGFLLPSSLNLMVSQRLVGRLCEKCKQETMPPPDVSDILQKELTKLRPGPYKIWRSPGCPACHQKGSLGRLAIFEALEMTPELADIINTGSTEAKIIEEAKRQGMVTLRQDGLLKAIEGLVSVEEVLRETTET